MPFWNRSPRQHQPPPIPYASKPTPTLERRVYWQPRFHPSIPISDAFGHEIGDVGRGNNEVQTYTNTPTNSFCTPGGQLVLRAIARSTAADAEQRFTSARLTSHQTLTLQQGCLTVRITAPSARGVWPAFWLLPAEPFKWPDDGEVDIFETWHGDPMNHSCLHWGHYDGKDWAKHRVVETHIPDLGRLGGKEYSFAWQQPEDGIGGKMVWYIDGRPVMKATIPQGTRRMSQWRIIINVAVGGNMCHGQLPADGVYDMVIHSIKMETAPPGGWSAFQASFVQAREGHTM